MTRIMAKREEPSDSSENQGQCQERVVEVEKILLRDETGKSRGKISANPDGSAGLILSDNEGSAWAWLGVNDDGEAFLELKDRKGEVRFKVSTEDPASGSTAESVVTALSRGPSESAPQVSSSQYTFQEPARPETEANAPKSGPGIDQSPSAVLPGWKPGFVDTTVYDRLEELERQNRGRKIFRVALMGLLALILATQAYLLSRSPYPQGLLEVEGLALRDQNGNLRALLGEKDGKLGLSLRDRQGKLRAVMGLEPDGSPALVLYDEEQRLRAGLQLWPNGEPRFNLQDNNSLMGKMEQNQPNDTGNQKSVAVSVPGDEDGTMASPAAGQEETVTGNTATEAIYLGSITSNKYHYPDCKWAKTIKPSRLIKFKSLEEAQGRHYIPCPVCKPPPLSK